MKKALKRGFAMVVYIAFTVSTFFQLWFEISRKDIIFLPFIYLLTIILFVVIVVTEKVKLNQVFWFAFILFVFSALSVVMGYKEVGEALTRLSLVGWSLAIIQIWFGHVSFDSASYKDNNLKH